MAMGLSMLCMFPAVVFLFLNWSTDDLSTNSDTAPSNNGAYSFNVGGLTDLSVGAYVNQSANVTLSYSAAVTLATQTATTSPTPSTQKSESTRVIAFGGSMARKMVLWVLVCFTTLFFAL
jgi:hypothetical protein